MKKLVIPALLLGALQAAGCIFVSGDDTTTDGVASIDVSWTLEDDGAPATCPAGATTAAINAQLEGRADPYVDLYNCSDLGGVADLLPLGNYTVWVDFTDDNGDLLYAQSEAVNITLDTDGEIATANFRVDMYNGFFDISWTIAGGSCASVTNDGVSVLSTLSGTTAGVDDVFTCSDGESPAIATTGALLIGDYVISVALLDASQAAIGEADPIQDTISFGNEFVDLGTVTINLL